MAVRVVTDSACDLLPEMCEQTGIEVVPLTIRFGDREYVDRKELSSDEFWRQLGSAPALPETSAPSVGAFEEAFRRLHAEGADGIVCVNLSAHLSATMQSAQVAAKALDGLCPIEIIDSGTASMGIGILALHAARRASEGADLATIADEVRARSERQTLYASLDTLEYLRKGGRIGGAQAMLGSMLSIKPIITVINGSVEQAGKVRTRSKALRFMLDRIPEGRVESICVMHSGATDLDEFLDLVRPKVPGAEIVVGHIGPVVGVHVGPRAIGMAWIERDGDGQSFGAVPTDDRDDALAAAASRGDRTALEELLERNAGMVHAVCRRVLSNPEDALDAAQEALIAIARRIETFDGRSKFTTWCYRVATNAALDEARRGNRRPSPVEIVAEPRADGPALDETVADRTDIDAALAHLSPEYRAAVALRDLVGLDYADIATILRIPPGTVRSRIARGRAALADQLSPHPIAGNQTPDSEHPNPRAP